MCLTLRHVPRLGHDLHELHLSGLFLQQLVPGVLPLRVLSGCGSTQRERHVQALSVAWMSKLHRNAVLPVLDALLQPKPDRLRLVVPRRLPRLQLELLLLRNSPVP